MGGTISNLFNAFECNSECSIHHELHQDIDKINFKDIELSQKQIKLINDIIKKDTIKKKKSISK